MRIHYPKISLLALAIPAFLLQSCIDDKYDLGNIDTSIRVRVNDLTVPVNLDAVQLSNIFNLGESVIKDFDGYYAVVVDGDFQSNPINIKKVNLGKPAISPTYATINPADIPGGIPSLPSGYVPVAFAIPELSTDFTYDTDNVEPSIKSIQRIEADWTITLNISFKDPSGIVSNMSVKDLRVQLPKGLDTPDYKNVDGIINLGDRTLTNGALKEEIRVSAVDFSAINASDFTLVADNNGNNPGRIHYKGFIGIKDGTLIGGIRTGNTSPSNISMTLNPVLSPIIIDSFSGDLQYPVEGLDATSVNLDGLPDILTQDETNIRLSNPQLYLSINNPLAGYKIEAHSGMQMVAMRPSGNNSYQLPAGTEINVGYNKGPDGPYTFCLSPQKPDAPYEGYPDFTHVPFPDLSSVLAGKGLPSQIDVYFSNARIGRSHVDKFRLGVSLNEVVGNYTFFAPLSFDPGSKVIYTNSDDGWNDDTLDKLTIEKLELTATVVNDLPFDITLTGYPLGTDSKQCVDPATNQPVFLGQIVVKAGETTQINLATTGTIVGLDGICYSAFAAVEGEGAQLLKPTTSIRLSDIRAKVSGYYDEKDDDK